MGGTSIRYGICVDFIESTLNALAAARAVFESKVPTGWKGSEDLLDCFGFQVKVGDMFLIPKP